jgi:RNA-binding protein 25
MIDRKLEPLVKRLMTKYLGELEDDDLVMFVLEHMKDHKGPLKLFEGVEPVSPLYLAWRWYSFLRRCWRRKLLSSQLAFGDRSYSRAWLTVKAFTRRDCW